MSLTSHEFNTEIKKIQGGRLHFFVLFFFLGVCECMKGGVSRLRLGDERRCICRWCEKKNHVKIYFEEEGGRTKLNEAISVPEAFYARHQFKQKCHRI